MEHGKYTKKLGENRIGVLKESLGVKVFYDHGGKDALTKAGLNIWNLILFWG